MGSVLGILAGCRARAVTFAHGDCGGCRKETGAWVCPVRQDGEFVEGRGSVRKELCVFLIVFSL